MCTQKHIPTHVVVRLHSTHDICMHTRGHGFSTFQSCSHQTFSRKTLSLPSLESIRSQNKETLFTYFWKSISKIENRSVAATGGGFKAHRGCLMRSCDLSFPSFRLGMIKSQFNQPLARTLLGESVFLKAMNFSQESVNFTFYISFPLYHNNEVLGNVNVIRDFHLNYFLNSCPPISPSNRPSFPE